MPRADLLALTDDGLTQLSNAGLVKRAQRELAAGTGPTLTELDDGAIEARFADGTLTRLAAGREIALATCTCPSSGVCRHRVMLAMAYREEKAGQTSAEAAEPEAWNPATLDLEAFEAALSPSEKTTLTRLLAARQTVRLDYGQTPSARLAMASVRFLVPGDIGYARCDCATGRACAHVALAIRAFRAADGAAEAVVGDTAPIEAAAGLDTLRNACDALVAHLAEVGVTAGPSAHVAFIDRARKQAEALGAAQALLTLDALAEQIHAYEARSARYDERAVLRLAAELFARTRAADASATLGLGEPFETAMAKARLISLGARLRQEGTDIRAAVLLADTDTGATMLMEKLFSPQPNDKEAFHTSVLRRQMAPAIALTGIGRGQLLTSVARRRADGLLALGSGAGGRTQIMPRDALFAFRPPLAAVNVDALKQAFAERPISLIRPRKQVEDVHVFDVEDVAGQSWSPGDQFWQAAVKLKGDGGMLHVERSYDAGAPSAITVLTAAMDGKWGQIRQIAGTVKRDGAVLVCEPWSLSADRFIVPDVDTSDITGDIGSPLAASGRLDAFDEVERMLSGLLHSGRRARSTLSALGKSLVARLETVGYRTMAERLSQLLPAEANDVSALGSAAVWLLVLKESRGT